MSTITEDPTAEQRLAAAHQEVEAARGEVQRLQRGPKTSAPDDGPITLQPDEWQMIANAATVGLRQAGRQMRASAASASSPSRPTTTRAAAASPAPSSKLTVGESGELVYDGNVPVRNTSAGEPAVFTDSGWMTVAAFEASPYTREHLDMPLVSMQFVPQGPTAAAFREGPK